MTTDSLFTLNLGEEVTLTDNVDDTNVKTSSFIKYGPDSGPFTLIESERDSDRTTAYNIKSFTITSNHRQTGVNIVSLVNRF